MTEDFLSLSLFKLDIIIYHWYTYYVTSIELKKWRIDHSLTQPKLGKLLGVTKTCIYRWEAEFRNIPPFLALALRALELEGGEIKARGKKKMIREVKK